MSSRSRTRSAPTSGPSSRTTTSGWFAVLKTAKYDEEREEVDFGEIHMFIGSGYLIAVRHGEASELKPARQRLEARPDLLAHGPVAAAWAILDKVVDDYDPVATGIEDDIEEVEEQVFAGVEDPSQRIYSLKREVIEFNRAVQPLLGPLEALERGAIVEVDDQMARYFRDVADHARRVYEQVASQRELLTSVLEANLVQISLRQNVVVRTISAWAAIIAVPTFIASVYGMNFDHMPELHSTVGYPLALAVMAVAVAALHRYFSRIGWIGPASEPEQELTTAGGRRAAAALLVADEVVRVRELEAAHRVAAGEVALLVADVDEDLVALILDLRPGALLYSFVVSPSSFRYSSFQPA